MTSPIVLAGLCAAAYLAWFGWQLVGGLRVVHVPLWRRSLRAISGYHAGAEGARNGGAHAR